MPLPPANHAWRAAAPARTRSQLLARGALLILVYVLAGKFGLSLAFLNSSATAVWPGTGLALAALLLWGMRLWPAVFLGAFIVNITTSGSWPTSVAIAAGNTAEAVLGCWLVLRFANGTRAFERAHDVLMFIALAAGVSTMLSATIGVTSLAVAGLAPWDRYAQIWFTWWIGDAVSDVMLAPALIVWGATRVPKLSLGQIVERGALLLTVAVIGQMAFGRGFPFYAHGYALTFLCVPPIVYAACQFGPRATAITALLMSALAIRGTVGGFGSFAATGDVNQSLLMLQAFMGTITGTGLLLAAAVSERRRVAEALSDGQHRLRLALEGGRMGTWEWSLRTGRVRWSPELEALHGLRPGAFGGTLEAFASDIHPEDRPRVLAAIDEAIAQRRDHHIEYRIVLPDGRTCWVEGRGRLLCDAEGAPDRMVGVCMDISDRKEVERAQGELNTELRASLREKEVLLREVHHRVKNNMQIISSLLSLQSDYLKHPDDVALFQESQARIRAMALVHEHLYLSKDLAQIDMAAYLRTLVAAIQQLAPAPGRTVSVEAEAITAGVDTAIPCGLVVHELVANALKHAFPGGRAGRVVVGLRREPPGWLELSISDDGVGLPPEVRLEDAPTLGLRLVHALCDQLQARLTIERRGGTTFRISMPGA